MKTSLESMFRMMLESLPEDDILQVYNITREIYDQKVIERLRNSPEARLTEEEKQLCQEGKKVKAIMAVKARLNMSLYTAKILVEHHESW